jgi:predicted membrane protein
MSQNRAKTIPRGLRPLTNVSLMIILFFMSSMWLCCSALIFYFDTWGYFLSILVTFIGAVVMIKAEREMGAKL